MNRAEERAAVAAAKAGDESAFAGLVERHRRELQVHCYRMLGSFEDSEDLVQETFLRAWRSRASFSFDGRWSLRAWLYRIATNACLDFLAARPRRVHVTAPESSNPVEVPWLQPYPDRLLEGSRRATPSPRPRSSRRRRSSWSSWSRSSTCRRGSGPS